MTDLQSVYFQYHKLLKNLEVYILDYLKECDQQITFVITNNFMYERDILIHHSLENYIGNLRVQEVIF